MSIESDLKKDGITVISALDKSSVLTIAKNVSEKIYLTFPNFGFTYEYLFERFSNTPMYIANIPKGMSEASYFYKNSSIYFRDGMGLNDLEKFAIHELIHSLQEKKDKKSNLLRLGLCEFTHSKIRGMALNEAAVQILTSNILDETFEIVKYYDISFSTNSPILYPLLCNLVTQMSYITGENLLFDSTFNSNDNFKNKFISLSGKKTYYKILSLLDNILSYEEKLIKYNNTLQSEDLEKLKSQKIMQKIEIVKESIKKEYFKTQELILNSYFNATSSSLLTIIDIESFRKKLYDFQELTGSTADYDFSNNLYINMMEELDKKVDTLTVTNTYLIPKKENKLQKILSIIKKLISKKELEQE